MQKHHYDRLLSRLEEVLLQGHATVTYDELKYWFDSHKIGKNVWKEIDDMWEEMPDVKGRDSGKNHPKGELWCKSLYDLNVFLLFSNKGLNRLFEPSEG